MENYIFYSSTSFFLCSDARLSRSRLLEQMIEPAVTLDEITTEFAKYNGLLVGFLYEINANGECGGDSKLRHLLTTRWTDSMLGPMPV